MPNTPKPVALESTAHALSTAIQGITNAIDTQAVQCDWDVNNKKSKAFIKNKPNNLWSPKTITGNPLSFQKRKAEPANETLISMNPIQDLHGYDYPWPAGGGKNLLEMSVAGIKSLNTSGTWSGNVYTLNGVTFEIKLDDDGNIQGILVGGSEASANAVLILGQSPLNVSSILNGCPGRGGNNTYKLRAYHTDGTSSKDDIGSGTTDYTPTSDEYYVRIIIYSGYKANLLFKPMVRLSTESDTSYAPYSNVCPISGRTGVEIDGCGKNLYDATSYPFVEGKFINANTGAYSNTSGFYATAEYIPCESMAGKSIVVNKSRPSGGNSGFAFYDENKTYISGVTGAIFPTTGNMTLTVPDEAKFMRFTLGPSSGGTSNVQIELGTEATPYEAYQSSNKITISFGETVYGGTPDVETGVVTVTNVTQSFTTAILYGNYGVDNAPLYYVQGINYDVKSVAGSSSVGFLSSNYFKRISLSTKSMKNNEIRTEGGGSPNKLYFRWDSATDVNEINTAFAQTPLQVCMELVTPRTIQLTPHQVNLLRGVNNIWTDGDSISFTYKDDAKNITDVATELNYISTDMAPNESTISTAAYQVSDYLILNNNFYKVTAPISIGDTIAVGTNVTRTTIGAELSLLHS